MHETLKIKKSRCGGARPERYARIMARTVEERCGARVVFVDDDSADVQLDVQPGAAGCEGFTITDAPSGGAMITGADDRGLYYGIGKYLRTCEYGENAIKGSAWRGSSTPSRRKRMIYFATHFHNFYHDAPVEKISRYIEDMMLWGFNGLVVWFDMHHFDGIDDPEAVEMLGRLRAMVKTVKSLGMESGLIALANEGFRNTPDSLRAQWQAQNGYVEKLLAHYHVEVCPAKPGGMERILENFDALFQYFASTGIDLLSLWPYDQGGCTCGQCAPWGAKGYLKAGAQVAGLFREYFPAGKVSLSTWWFDYVYPGEWEAFAKAAEGRIDWADYLLIDAHCERPFPQYPLNHGVPDNKPVLNFPEISMHGMFPWGGYGANPFPEQLQTLWNSARHLIQGGYPYSEGIYEDMNKAVCAQFYWEDRDWRETVREYIGYYFGHETVDLLLPVVEIMEQSLIHGMKTEGATRRIDIPRKDRVEEARERVQRAESRMISQARKDWRWRLFAIRSLIDAEVASHPGEIGDAIEGAFSELIEIYHAHNAVSVVMPPAKSAPRRPW